MSQSPSKKGNVKNKLLAPRPGPFVQPKSNGGVPFKQAGVLIYLTVIDQTSSHADLCYNWSFSDDQGVADFPHAFFAKPGSVVLRATGRGHGHFRGGCANPGGRGDGAGPQVQRRQQQTCSPDRQVPGVQRHNVLYQHPESECPEEEIASGDPTTYPPNYDVVTFPNP